MEVKYRRALLVPNYVSVYIKNESKCIRDYFNGVLSMLATGAVIQNLPFL